MNLLNEESDSKLFARKQNIDNDQSNVNYHVGNEIISETEVFSSNLFDYNNSCILVKGGITIER